MKRIFRVCGQVPSSKGVTIAWTHNVFNGFKVKMDPMVQEINIESMDPYLQGIQRMDSQFQEI